MTPASGIVLLSDGAVVVINEGHDVAVAIIEGHGAGSIKPGEGSFGSSLELGLMVLLSEGEPLRPPLRAVVVVAVATKEEHNAGVVVAEVELDVIDNSEVAVGDYARSEKM